MKFRNIFAAMLVLLFALAPAGSEAASKPVLVHYMPWFVSKPYSGSWGYHWTLNHYNPDLTDSTTGRQEIASWYYPLIGPYDSLDPAVLEYHVLLMKLGGVDGVIVDWYGMDNFYDYGINNQRTLALFKYIQKANLTFSLCYEDQTIGSEISGGFITGANAISHAQQTMLYMQTNFFMNANYFRINGAPVFLNFGPQFFKTNADWVTVFSVLNATNKPAFFTEDNRLAVGAGAFDWPPMSLSVNGTLTPTALQGYLASFEQKAAGWPNYVSSGFPRFHDIYAQAGVGSSYGLLDDANGLTLTNTLQRALTNKSSAVQVVTWNDYGEGTIVEPTLDYGYRDLGMIQDFRRRYLDGNFAYHTNDLNTALRIYKLRKKYGSTGAMGAELDRVFTNVISGKLSVATQRVTAIESNRPVIYNLALNGTQLQFSIGGYVAGTVQVQMSTNLVDWQTVRSFAASTNVSVFTTNATQKVCTFFKVQ